MSFGNSTVGLLVKYFSNVLRLTNLEPIKSSNLKFEFVIPKPPTLASQSASHISVLNFDCDFKTDSTFATVIEGLFIVPVVVTSTPVI